jgi:hypothetical protein
VPEQSDKHGPRQDDALTSEIEGTVRGGHGNRAEEWREAEPAGEDQPSADRDPGAAGRGATPHGMSGGDVELRAEVARFLGKEVFPAERDRLLAVAAENNATDAVMGRLSSLPARREFTNVQAVMTQLGIGVEDERF